MDLTTIPQSLFEKVVNIPHEKISRSQKNILEAVIGAWQQYRKDSLRKPFPEPDTINRFDLDDFAPGSPDNYINISWHKQASFHINGSRANQGDVICTIYTFDSRNQMSPPRHFRIREDWQYVDDKSKHFEEVCKALSIAIGSVLRHIDLSNYQDNYQDDFYY